MVCAVTIILSFAVGTLTSHSKSLCFLFSSKATDLVYCQNLVATLNNTKDLPALCRSYSSVIEAVNQKNAGNANEEGIDVAFQSMTAGATVQAGRSRARGNLSRRMTSNRSNRGDTLTDR